MEEIKILNKSKNPNKNGRRYTDTKIECAVCHELKPDEEFNIHRASFRGKHNQCKICERRKAKERYHNNPEYRAREKLYQRRHNLKKKRKKAEAQEAQQLAQKVKEQAAEIERLKQQLKHSKKVLNWIKTCLLYTSPSPRD